MQDEFTKVAISAGRTLAAIQARAAQGARVAPGLMQRAEQAAASGMASTPSFMRRTALGAAESGQAAQRAQAFGANPITQGARARAGAAYENAIQNPTAVRNMSAAPVVGAADMGATGMTEAVHGRTIAQPYTKAHADAMFGSNSQMTMAPRAMTPTPTGRIEATATAVPMKKRMTMHGGLEQTGVGTQVGQSGGFVDQRFGQVQAPGARSMQTLPAARPAAPTGDVTAVGKKRPLAPAAQPDATVVTPNPFDRTQLSLSGVRR